MGANMFEFVWRVPADPHRWTAGEPVGDDADRATGPFLVRDGMTLFREIDVRQYAPLRDRPTLFREFTAIDPDDRGAIAAFADRNGWLGVGVPVRDNAEAVPGPWGDTVGEPLGVWQAEIRAMRRVAWVFDQLDGRTVDGLRRLAEVIQPPKAGRGNWSFRTGPTSPPEVRAAGGVRVAIPEPSPGFFVAGDVTLPATFYMLAVINERLAGEKGQARVSPQVLFDTDQRRPVFVVRPGNLLAAMWLQLADVVTGSRQQRRCVHCGTFYEIRGEDGRTARSMFCSKRCKMADHRRRKEEQAGAEPTEG